MARFIMSSLVSKHGLKYARTASPNVPIDTQFTVILPYLIQRYITLAAGTA